METPVPLTLLFDGSCNFCTASAELLRVLDRRGSLHCLPFQIPELPQSYGLTIKQCEEAIWAITSTGQKYRGAQAVNVALDSLTNHHFFLRFYQLRGIKQIENRIYSWIARNRRFLPGMRPYCQRPETPCGK
ncbi:MAG TPA: DUF393 domain-containing protein [Ktedonobacteraceae bacterium]|nr:DUF393 domain-containing protein [Ktedonobacteraceae bacterium]